MPHLQVPSEIIIQSIGVVGFFLYMLSYLLLQLEVIRGTQGIYRGLNIAAASCVMISLMGDFNLASFLIQAAWIIISLIGFARQFQLRQTVSTQMERT